MKESRPFCKTLPWTPELQKWRESMPKMEIWFTPRCKCIVTIDGVDISKSPHHKTDNQHRPI